jgi:hypothetical protein
MIEACLIASLVFTNPANHMTVALKQDANCTVMYRTSTYPLPLPPPVAVQPLPAPPPIAAPNVPPPKAAAKRHKAKRLKAATVFRRVQSLAKRKTQQRRGLTPAKLPGKRRIYHIEKPKWRFW